MDIFFLILLLIVLALALGSGFPVAFAIPGAAILTVSLAAVSGLVFSGDANAYFSHSGGPYEWLSTGISNFRGMYRSDDGDTLIAIPIFIFMGLMLQHSKIAEDLLVGMSKLLGMFRGGLGLSVVLVGALLAATTSVVGATVATIGTISLPSLLKNGYPKPLASGLVAATGTLGQIIPPSIVLVILAHQLSTAVNKASGIRRAMFKDATGGLLMPSEFDVSSVSAGEIFIGAIVPGLLLVLLYMAYVIFRTSSLPRIIIPAAEKSNLIRYVLQTFLVVLPPFVLILLVLGSIMAGVATINQSAAIGAAGATIIAGARLYHGQRASKMPAILAVLAFLILWAVVMFHPVNLRKIYTEADIGWAITAAIGLLLLFAALGWSGWRVQKANGVLFRVMEETLKTTSLVFAILLGAVMLTAAFRSFGGEVLVRHYLQGLPGGFWGKFSVAMLIIFFLGFFLDFIEITVLVIPIVAPILLADPSANVAAVWLGVIIAMNIQTSFLTPPFGFALFYLRGVAPSCVRTLDIYKGVAPFIGVQILAIVIVTAAPALVSYLPTRLLLLSEHAPPPTNPKLQSCLERYVLQDISVTAPKLEQSIAAIRALDLAFVPAKLRDALLQSLNASEASITLISRLNAPYVAVEAAAKKYRPLLVTVRTLQQKAGRLDLKISNLQNMLSQNISITPDEESHNISLAIKSLTQRRDELLAGIPSDWQNSRQAFLVLQEAENSTRVLYRRNADRAYADLNNFRKALNETDKLEEALAEFKAIRLALASASEPKLDVIAQIDGVYSNLRQMTDMKDALLPIKQSRESMAEESPSMSNAATALDKAIVALDAELQWRVEARRSVGPVLDVYARTFSRSIGLRSLPRLPREVSLFLASCSSSPTDIFLHF